MSEYVATVRFEAADGREALRAIETAAREIECVTRTEQQEPQVTFTIEGSK